MGRTTRLMALGLVALCVGSMAAWAQTIEKEEVDTALTGEITLIDTKARTVALQGANGERAVVRIDDKTTIMSEAKKIGLEGLGEGAWVAVDADRHGDSLVATYIEVVEGPTDTGSP